MKQLIDKVTFDRQFPTKYGERFKFKIDFYDENDQIKTGYYVSKSRDQTKFIAGQESEFEISTREIPMGGYETVIKPIYEPQNSGFARKVKDERARYSGFSASYVKDMMVAGVIKPETDEQAIRWNEVVLLTWRKRSLEIWEHLVKLDSKPE